MTDDFAGLPSYDVLASPVPEPGRKPATWWVVGGVVALVAALIGGITYGAASLSGGGEQPEGALPAGAVAFATVARVVSDKSRPSAASTDVCQLSSEDEVVSTKPRPGLPNARARASTAAPRSGADAGGIRPEVSASAKFMRETSAPVFVHASAASL